MSVGTLSMTCLLLLTGQTPEVSPDWINQHNFKIPVAFEAGRRAELREIHLYLSRDRGKSWEFYKKITPEQDYFTYYGDKDGYFWFQIIAVNKQGKMDPASPHDRPPCRKIVIDTVKPVIKITSAERKNGELVVSWFIQEEYPNPETMKLEYHSDDQPPHVWQPIKATPGETGTGRVHLTTDSPVTVRLALKDFAENLSVEQKPVPSATGVLPVAFSTTANPIPPPMTTTAPPPPPPPPVAVPSATSTLKQEVPLPPLPPTPAASTQTTPVPPLPPVEHAHTPPHPWSQGTPPHPQAPAAVSSQVVARSDVAPPVPQPAPVEPVKSAPKLPAKQIVNDKEIILEYELSKVGPSGIKSVELWVSTDNGKSWGKEPFEDEAPAKESTSGGKYQRTLTLPADGVYGLYMVVRNKVGMGKPTPKPGDAPEMIIEVDTKPPVAQLWGPQPLPGQRETVVLTWTAEDDNLAPNPITLEWSEKKEGEWHVIGTPNMPNVRSYHWKLPPNIPPWVYLRLRARDTAGNEGVAVTAERQLVDLTLPEGKLLDVRPAHR